MKRLNSSLRNLWKKERELIALNIITIFGFCLYAYGIYLHTAIRGKQWGNVAIDLSIQILGPLLGVIVVVMIGALILLFTLEITPFHTTNIFLCWFWIFSLYQCAVNSLLNFVNHPNEPINQFFKWLFPTLWYPVKEICFVLTAVLLTYLWLQKISKKELTKLDMLLILILSTCLILTTLGSQLLLINNNSSTYFGSLIYS